jgi:[ribosomal protein S18]-alanine N-acetyltransferase
VSAAAGIRVVPLGPGDDATVLEAADLFDAPPTAAWTSRYLESAGHHLLVALAADRPIGFVTGIETTHPDKGTEMFLYELSVHADHRNRGAGRALVGALAELARSRGCYGMWVATDAANSAALATYAAAGAEPPEPCVTLTWTF